jgi:hypothetical protein
MTRTRWWPNTQLGQLARSRAANNRARVRSDETGAYRSRIFTKDAFGSGTRAFEHEDEDEHDYDFAFSSADGGGRTHTTLRSLDFESSASANSATSAYLQGRMVYRFLQKRKGFVIRTEGEASLNSSTACGRFGVSKARSASAMKWQNKLAQGFSPG